MYSRDYDWRSFAEGLHVLFVDDSEDERELFRLRLEPYDVRVDTVETTWQALGLLERGDTDVFVTNVVFPESSVCDVARILHDPGIDEPLVPSVAVTGLARPTDVDGLRRVGFDDVLVKPYTTDDLFAALEARLPQVAALRPRREHFTQRRYHLQQLRHELVRRQAQLEL